MTVEDQQHIEQTIEKERGRLLSFIRGKVKSMEDAEDIMQDVFYQLLNGFGTIGSLEKTTSWLFRVARNKIVDLYRKKKPESFSSLSAPNEGGILNFEDILPNLEPNSPEDQLMRDAIWHEVQTALSELPGDQRDVFVWHEFEDMSFKDISSMTGEPVNTLISRKRYAILHLRERLSMLYQELS